MKTKFKPKTQKQIITYTRAAIQLLFFIFLPSAFTSAFAGVKYIFTQMNLKASIEFTSFVVVLIALCAFTIVFGRFFCGFVCAFGSLGDAVHAIYIKICKKLKRKPLKINPKLDKFMIYCKYVILLAIVLLCFFGVYGSLSGWSPWDVFSMARAGNFKLASHILGLILLIIIIVSMAIEERFFCKFLCPMGAIFSFLPILPFLALTRNRDNCIKGCTACQRNCPANIGLADKYSYSDKGNCFQCQKCINTCPKKNVGTKFNKLKGDEIWFTVLRAGLLAVLLILVGV